MGCKMKFKISRASDWKYEGQKPCDNAVYDKLKKEWFIELNTLEELVNLSDYHGEPVIVDGDKRRCEIPEIEFYDDYIE